MINSYRVKAERRASLSRASAARADAKRLVELPPWGYGNGRAVLSTPLTTINNARRLTKKRTRSVPPARQTNTCCVTGPAQTAAPSSRPNVGNDDPSNWSNSTTYGCDGAELVVVVEPNSAESVAQKCELGEISGNTATGATTDVPTQHPHTVQEADDSIGDAVVTGGGPVTSSSMETWTTYDGTSTSPRVQSTISSPHSQGSTSNTPLSPPQSATSWLFRLSPTILTTRAAPLDTTLTTDSAINKIDAANGLVTSASAPPDVANSQKSITSTTQPTANEPMTAVAQEVAPTDGSHEQKKVESSVDDSSASGEVTVNTPISVNSGNDGKGTTIHRVASTTYSARSPTTTSEPNDENKSSLMVGLVKVKSRHTGLMIDCPILETLYQNEAVEPSATPVRQSSSHKVVLIKAVVPRWAWNGREQFTPDSSTRASPSSTRTTSRGSVDHKISKRKSLVSVNTQTSDTLLPVRRTISEHQGTPLSPITAVDAYKYVPALEDNCQLTPSPKQSAYLTRCKSTPKTLTECNLRSPVPPSSNNTSCLSSARVQNKNTIPAETSNVLTSLLLHGNMPVMSEKPKESESIEGPSASMDYDSLMEDTIETLKLDLHFSSSGNNSDSDSVIHRKTAAKRPTAECLNRCLSSSSDEMGCDRQPSSSCQGMPTINWSCAATAATASSDAIENFRTSSYINEMVVCMEPTPSSPHQKPTSAGRSARTPPPQGRSPISDLDNHRPRVDDASRRLSNNKCHSNPNSSQRNEAKAARLMPDSCSRQNRSPCPWRSVMSDNVELASWPERDLNCQDPHQYEQQQQQHHHQSPPSHQHISSTTQYASRSESSLSDRSKSTFHDCYEVLTTTKASPTMSSISSRNPHAEQSSTLPPGQFVTSGGSDTCATDHFDVNVHHRRATNKHQSHPAGNLESPSHQSRHKQRRSTPEKKHRATEQKSPTQERYKRSTSGTKRSGDRQRKHSAESTRGDIAQSSQSTGSMAVSRNARLPAATTKRQHSSSDRHVPRNARTDKRSPTRNISANRPVSSSRGQYCSTEDNRRRNHVHNENHSTSDLVSRRADRQTTSSGRRQRHGSRTINASLSRSADSMSRRRGRPPSVHANYSVSVAEPSNSSQSKRADNRQSRHRDDHQSPSVYYECRQPVVYRSPRSMKPFPPPVSDRYPPSSFDNLAPAVVGTSLDAESVQYVFVQRQDDSYYGDDQPCVRTDYPPSNVPPSHPQERLYRPVQTGTDELDHQRRGNGAAVGGRRRKKLPATPVVDGQSWCAEPEVSVRIAVPSVIERPAWRRY